MAFKSYHDDKVRWERTKQENYERHDRNHCCYNCFYCRRYRGNYYCTNDNSTKTSAYQAACSSYSPSPYSSPIDLD